MNINIKPTKILEYYDIPLVFLGKDKFNCSYLCTCVEDDPIKYICIQMSEPRINELLSNTVSLRTCYTQPENKIFFESIIESQDDLIVLNEIVLADLPEEYLPEADYKIPSKIYNQELIDKALEFKHPIIYLGIKNKTNSHSLPICKLGEVLEKYQSLVTNCLRKIDNKADENISILNAYKTSAASFNIHMYAESPMDMFGNSRIDSTLKTINDLFQATEDNDLKSKLTKLKGRAVNSYKNLIEYLYINDYELKYRWTSDLSNHEVISNTISISTIKRNYDILMEHIELSKEIREFECIFSAVDSSTGRWKIKDLLNKKKTYNGVVAQPSMLSGIIINKQKYRIRCEEKEVENNINIKNKTILELIKYNEI